MHRREARVTAGLPAHAPAPRLLGCHDDGDWVAPVLTDVPGRHPGTPWSAAELDAVITALDALAAPSISASLPDLPSASERLNWDFAGWHRIAADAPADLDPWAADQLTDLCALADQGLTALTGNALTHTDIRADNLLIGPDGGVTLVDWPWACRPG